MGGSTVDVLAAVIQETRQARDEQASRCAALQRQVDRLEWEAARWAPDTGTTQAGGAGDGIAEAQAAGPDPEVARLSADLAATAARAAAAEEEAARLRGYLAQHLEGGDMSLLEQRDEAVRDFEEMTRERDQALDESRTARRERDDAHGARRSAERRSGDLRRLLEEHAPEALAAYEAQGAGTEDTAP